jgi:hypothetical protein
MSSSADKSKRPSPTASATQFSVGERKKGNDGNLWEIATDKNGVKRWKRVGTTSTTSKTATTSKAATTKATTKAATTKGATISKAGNSKISGNFGSSPSEIVKENLGSIIDKIIDKKVKTKKFFYTDSYRKKPLLSKDEEDIILQIVKKVATDVGINVKNITKFADIFVEGLTRASVPPRRNSFLYESDSESLVEKLGPPEVRGFVARDSNGIFIDAFLAPGENSHGYVIYYHIKSQMSYVIYQNWDGGYIPKPKFKSTVKKYTDISNDIETYDGRFTCQIF